MARRQDPKEQALREARTLNPRPEAVVDEAFAASEFFDARDLVQVKYEMVRRVQVDGEAVSHAAAAFGFSRPSYYEAAAALIRDGLPGLVPDKPGPRQGHKLTPTRYLTMPRRCWPSIPCCGPRIWSRRCASGSGSRCTLARSSGR